MPIASDQPTPTPTSASRRNRLPYILGSKEAGTPPTPLHPKQPDVDIESLIDYPGLGRPTPQA